MKNINYLIYILFNLFQSDSRDKFMQLCQRLVAALLQQMSWP